MKYFLRARSRSASPLSDRPVQYRCTTRSDGLKSSLHIMPAAAPTRANMAVSRLPAGASLSLVRKDLLATASEKFDLTALDETRAAPDFLIVKHFAGMAPRHRPRPGLTGSLRRWRLC